MLGAVSNADFLTRDELLQLGFSSVGERVRVSRKSCFYSIRGSMGNDVRIDDFAILKGRVEIGNHVHVAAFCLVSGARGTVRLHDFCSLSARVSVYTGSDDYGSDRLSGAHVDDEYSKTVAGDVVVGRSALVGAHSVIMPGVVIGDAASVGALSLVHRNVNDGHYMVNGVSQLKLRRQRDVQAIMSLASQVLQNEGSK